MKVTPEQKEIIKRYTINESIQTGQNDSMTEGYQLDRSFLNDAKKLHNLELKTRHAIHIEMTKMNSIWNVWKRTKAAYHYHIKKDSTYYPKLSNMLGVEHDVFKKGIGELEVLIKRIDNNNNTLFNEQGEAIKYLREANNMIKEYSPKRDETMNDLVAISSILKNHRNHDDDVVIDALEANRNLMHNLADSTEKYMLGRANKKNYFQRTIFLERLQGVSYMLKLGSSLKLSFYKTTEASIGNLRTVIDDLPETIRKLAGVEESYTKLQNMLSKYKAVTSALQAVEMKQLEHTMGPDNAREVCESMYNAT